ncbi:Oidioi.mRNA.OKI2018_I69.XSR.g15816.t1.cds [Oikopleura dioica]|uniref:Oidioi.mRNA.OKI2018_I69.XSR.g15816.t1.cds n=1 Tax=Oikopleura dioica TaxID=34765 RepID=A0ABN7SJ68_OIKDI|nr:Oidioi.mRNA.OKI2018_I69.XSR.g15816.t1.cds [Oikopleura dioica]
MNLALGNAIYAEPACLTLPQHLSHVIEIAYMVRVDYVIHGRAFLFGQNCKRFCEKFSVLFVLYRQLRLSSSSLLLNSRSSENLNELVLHSTVIEKALMNDLSIQNEELATLAGIENCKELEFRNRGFSDSSGCSSDEKAPSSQPIAIADGAGSRRASQSSAKGSTRSRNNSKAESTGVSVGSSGVGSLQKVPPATAFKDFCKKGFGDRKSRAAQGRGLAKKQGGGGSFTWGKPGCELDDRNNVSVNVDDPNYDPFQDPDIVFDSLEIEPSTEEIASELEQCIGEYFNTADQAAFLEQVEGMMIKNNRSFVLEQLLESSLEQKNEYRELASKATKYFFDLQYYDVITVARGFSVLLDRLADLILDTPEAPEILGKFISRSILDGCLPDNFISEELRGAGSLVRRCLDYSSALNKDPRSVETCWGTAIGGFTDTSVLTEKIRELLKEFLSSGDKDEASKCLRELDVPHFHHELVFEAILIAMEAEDENVINQMTWLLQYMFKEGVLSVDQMHAGFSRFYANRSSFSALPNGRSFRKNRTDVSEQITQTIFLRIRRQHRLWPFQSNE